MCTYRVLCFLFLWLSNPLCVALWLFICAVTVLPLLLLLAANADFTDVAAIDPPTTIVAAIKIEQVQYYGFFKKIIIDGSLDGRK
jgi:hypothetical protein